MTSPRPLSRTAQSVGWTAVGLLGCLAVPSVLTIGVIIVLPCAAGLAAYLLWRQGNAVAAAVLVLFAAVPVALPAWLHRTGPIDECHLTAAGRECTYMPSPWPWALVSLLLLLAGLALLRSAVRSLTRVGAA